MKLKQRAAMILKEVAKREGGLEVEYWNYHFQSVSVTPEGVFQGKYDGRVFPINQPGDKFYENPPAVIDLVGEIDPNKYYICEWCPGASHLDLPWSILGALLEDPRWQKTLADVERELG